MSAGRDVPAAVTISPADIKREAAAAGFDLCGVAPARDHLELRYFREWLDLADRERDGFTARIAELGFEQLARFVALEAAAADGFHGDDVHAVELQRTLDAAVRGFAFPPVEHAFEAGRAVRDLHRDLFRTEPAEHGAERLFDRVATAARMPGGRQRRELVGVDLEDGRVGNDIAVAERRPQGFGLELGRRGRDRGERVVLAHAVDIDAFDLHARHHVTRVDDPFEHGEEEDATSTMPARANATAHNTRRPEVERARTTLRECAATDPMTPGRLPKASARLRTEAPTFTCGNAHEQGEFGG